nr:hypothetical protein [Tanacetum cinerariifolium]
MSSALSAVTYTFVYTNSKPGRPVALPSSNYIPGLEEPHDPDYVPEPIYPEYIPLEDEPVLLAKEQPLPHVVSLTAESPGDDDDDDSSEDDADDDDDDKDEEDKEEEEEHLALADSANVVPTFEPVSSPEGKEPITPLPSTDTTTTRARITVRLQAFTSIPQEVEVKRLQAIPTPPPSPLTSLSPPSVGERLARCMAPSAHSSPPVVPLLLLPSSGCPTQIQALRPSGSQGINYGFVNTLDAEARRRGIREVGYSIRDAWVDLAEVVLKIAPITLGEVHTRVTELAELHEHDTQDLYALLEDAQDSRTRISQRVTTDSQRVDLLMEDRISHQETILIVEEEAYVAREAWHIGRSNSCRVLLSRHNTRQIMAHVTRQGPNIPPNNTNPNNMTPGSVQAMIDQALLQNSTNGHESHSSHGDNRRNVQIACPCFYADFMKCQPLNFNGTKRVVGLTRWIEKVESVFNISSCAIENQVKFAICTMLGAALTWWNGHIRS